MGITKTHEQFCKEMFDKYGNEYTILGKYAGVHTYILVKHNSCGHEWLITPHSLLTNKKNTARCPNCNGGLYSYEQIVGYIENNSDCELITKKQEYINANTPIILKCNCGEIFETTFINFKHENKRQCNQCGFKLRGDWRKHSYIDVKHYVENLGYKLLSEIYENSATPLLLKCEKGHVFSKRFNDLLKGSGCHECAIENQSGENHWNWQGGITETSQHLRILIRDWKQQSMKNCNYKCILTGERFDHIHHLYSFNKIIKETFDILKIKIKIYISDYSIEQLQLIDKTFLELHSKYPLGVCLTKDIHDLYHRIYGDDNTPEQFKEFINKYKNN